MSYLKKFIEAVGYKNELFPDEIPLDIETYKSYSKQGSISKNDLNELKEISLDFLGGFYGSYGNIRLKCHSVSNLFKKYLNDYHKNEYNDNEVAVTIGDVSFNGNFMHNLNKEKLNDILVAGKKLDESLDVHVWITYKSSYIFDFTIKDNLKLTSIRENKLEDCLLLWDDNNKQEFDYLPLLVDNKFFHRVDE
jgi:hypothetical protein